MTGFNNVGKSHGPTEMPKDIVERAGTVGVPEVIEFALRPNLQDLGLKLRNWSEAPRAGLGKRKVDLRMGGGKRDGATNALTKTAILARHSSFTSSRNPAAQIHAKVKRT